jgi:hypothetical protein
LKFPPDCNDFSVNGIETALEELLNLSSAEITTTSDPCDSGCEVMYFFLRTVPASRAVLSDIDDSMLSSLDSSGQQMTIRINDMDSRENPWTRIVDSWGTTLNYDYYVNDQEDSGLSYEQRAETVRAFPLITSAGPDRQFGTDDDIYNRERTESP